MKNINDMVDKANELAAQKYPNLSESELKNQPDYVDILEKLRQLEEEKKTLDKKLRKINLIERMYGKDNFDNAMSMYDAISNATEDPATSQSVKQILNTIMNYIAQKNDQNPNQDDLNGFASEGDLTMFGGFGVDGRDMNIGF